MPTVSAAFGCSPTARVRRPQRDRKRKTWNTMTMTIRLIEIGPWFRIAPMSHPMIGRLTTASGRQSEPAACRGPQIGRAAKLPAPCGEDGEISVLR